VQRLFCWSMLVCVSAAPMAVGDDDAGDRDDAKRVQGTWKPVTAEFAGKPFPEEVRKAMTLVLTDGKYTVTIGEQKDEGTWKLDPAKTPRALDITGTKGPNQGKTFLCIYELTGDTLRVCYDLSGKERPTEFKTREGTQLFLVEYKRQKP
jgi:uncharacterized protein (TIGR03067 family)